MCTTALRHPAMAAALLILIGCDARDMAAFRPGSPGAGPSPVASSAAARARVAPGAPLPSAKPPGATPGGPGGSADKTVDTANVSPERLIGLDAENVERLLGPPNELADRPPAKGWRYRTERCTLDLSLYLDVKSKVFRTLAYEVTSHDSSDQGKRLCLAELEARRRDK
jgi:hypothetical protein